MVNGEPLNAKGLGCRSWVIAGHALLAQAAAEAVQQWKYEPTYLNGRPVPVILTAKVTFQLSAAGR